MSTKSAITPLLGEVIRRMLIEDGAILDVEGVYKRLEAEHGSELYSAARQLAEVAIRGKIKTHLKNSHALSQANPNQQASFLDDDAPATLAIRRQDGSFAYVPLRMASLQHIEAATQLRRDNIANVQNSFERWQANTQPVVEIMRKNNVIYGEAEKILLTQK